MNTHENPRIIMIQGDAYLASSINSIIKRRDIDDDDEELTFEVNTDDSSQKTYCFDDTEEMNKAHAQAVKVWQIGLGDCLVIDDKVARSFGT